MGNKLDNWSLRLSLVGSLSFFISFMLLFYSGSSPGLIIYLFLASSSLMSLIAIVGILMGIVALFRKSENKWIPLIAIILPIITFFILIVGAYFGLWNPFNIIIALI